MKTASQLILEAAEKPNKFGCLMMELKYDDSKLKAAFDDNDFFQEEGGYEKFHHVTILYGFHDNVDPKEVLEVAQAKSNFKGRNIVLNKISLFKNEKFDVIKFDVLDAEINKLNKLVTQNFEYTNKYPVYHAHATIAYVNAGTGDKYLKKLSGTVINANVCGFTYSTANKKKTNIPI